MQVKWHLIAICFGGALPLMKYSAEAFCGPLLGQALSVASHIRFPPPFREKDSEISAGLMATPNRDQLSQQPLQLRVATW